jgi:peroxiredoxin
MSFRRRLAQGSIVAPRELRTVYSDAVRIPDPSKLVHLQFRRYASCPICNLHLRSFALRHHDIQSAAIVEVVVFESTADSLQEHDGRSLPFALVADPQRRLYAEFGVSRGVRAVLNPRAWSSAVRGVGAFGVGIPASMKVALNLPADFLIASDGKILTCKYGVHADDQWEVDELLTLARESQHTEYRPGLIAQAR